MKIGAEDKKKVLIMAGLAVVAVALLIYNFSSLTGSAAAPAPAPVTPAPDASENHPPEKKAGIPQVRQKTIDPSLRTDILAASQKIEYSGGERNIFQMETERIPIAQIGSVRTNTPQVVPPPSGPPPKPPIPLKYYGFSNRPGEAKKAFLQDGENIFVAVEGDVVERRYKIVKIMNGSILVEDVLDNNQQKIDLTPPAQQTTG